MNGELRDGMTWGRWFAGFGLIVGLAVLFGMVSHYRFGVNAGRAAVLPMAVPLLLTAIGRPRMVYLVMRNARGFDYLERESDVRKVAGALGLLALIVGPFVAE